jgi:hypothetical protein
MVDVWIKVGTASLSTHLQIEENCRLSMNFLAIDGVLGIS